MAEKEAGRVPSCDDIPCNWLGRWGTDGNFTFICLKSGDLFVLYGEPSKELLALLAEECTNGSGLHVPYFHEESFWIEEMLIRVRDPFQKVDPVDISFNEQ